jgi:acetyl-CoA carboxylase biotin carboxyl carrier protein
MAKKTKKAVRGSASSPQSKPAKAGSFSPLPFPPDSLGDLFDFLKTKGITEFEWAKGDQKISVKTTYGENYSAPSHAPIHHAPATSSSSGAASSAPKESKEPSTHKRVNSPLVGTFYRSPSPTAASYAEVGKRVKKGDTLCIVEAMKLMNEIEADFSGTIVKVLVENGQPVEFGEPLFVIDTA